MSDDDDDESRSIASVSTYNEAYHGEEYVQYVSNWKLIEHLPHRRNIFVRNRGYDDDLEPSSFTREEWIQFGRAIGGNTTITRLVVAVDARGDDNPIRSIDVQDAFCAGLARNRSIEVFLTSGLDYTSGQMEIMRPFFSQSADLTKISFSACQLDSDAIDGLIEAIKDRGENISTIRSFEYSRATVSQSHISALVLTSACATLLHHSLRAKTAC